MDINQVKFLNGEFNKDNGKGKTVAKSVYYDLDNNIAFRNSHDFVFFDEGNKLIHCISANRNSNVKDEAPYTLMSADYSQLQLTEANFDMEGLKTILDSAICASITQNQKDAIIEWAQKLPVHPKNPNVGLDYYKNGEISIPQRPVTEDMAKTEAASHESLDWHLYIDSQVGSFVSKIVEKNPAYSSVSLRNHSVYLTTNSAENLDIGFTEFLAGLDGLETVEFRVGEETFTLNISDKSTYAKFKEGVISTMPTENGKTTNATITGTGKSTVKYTLNVKYYNKAEETCEVNGKVYSSINTALADIGTAPATIALTNDVTENIIVPDNGDVTIKLEGKSIANKDTADTIIVGAGAKLTISGNGTIDNSVHGKACIKNEVGGEVTILGGIFTRSKEDSKTNSFYAIQNLGKLVIGEEGGDNSAINVTAIGDFSSLICNEIDSEKVKVPDDTVVEIVINSGTFVGGINTVKNGEYGKCTINGGNFINSTQSAVLNWNDCTINGGNFSAPDLVCVTNGAYNAYAKGKLNITGGVFDAGAGKCVDVVGSYPSTDIHISGGTYSDDPSQYVIDGYRATKNEAGKYVVSEFNLEAKIDSIINGIGSLNIEKDTSAANTYNITTENAGISSSGLFDQIAAIEGVKTITIKISDGTEVVYNAGDDLEAFKTAVDAYCPTNNDVPAVILEMIVSMK